MTVSRSQIFKSIIACSAFLLQAIFSSAYSQSRPEALLPDSSYAYCMPIDMEPFLAGNFGELRNNHFHAGLDFKTQSTVDHPVYAFADGYVSRIGINAYGYGLVVYVRHPQLGLTSVYGHLNSFSDSIYNNVRMRQVELEQNNAQISFGVGELPVSCGDVIALSGNTGSSGGPHVHFELRDCNDDDDEFFNPMPFFRDRIADHKPPRASHIYMYPLGGVACGQRSRQSAQVIVSQSGTRTINRKFTAWGRIGIGLKAYDYMENQSNTYGVYRIRLYLDDTLIYDFCEDRFRYSERRYTNSLTDYQAWQSQKSMIMKSFIEPGNRLRMLDHQLGDGSVMIDEERAYRFRYLLEDAHGNSSEVNFTVTGKRTDIPAADPLAGAGIPVTASQPASYDSAGFSFRITPGNLYTDQLLRFRVSRQVDAEKRHVSKVCIVGDPSIPVHGHADLAIPVPQAYSDTLTAPSQLYVSTLSGSYVGGTFEPAHKGRPAVMRCQIRELGSFVILRDTTSPTASFVSLGWSKAQISVSDTGSGIDVFKVFIDDRFVPFDQNRYGKRLAEPRKYGIQKGRNHQIRIWLRDKCGNERTIETTKYF